MSFLSNVTNALSNPFVRQIAGGVAGLAKGAQGVQVVDKGFKIFDQLLSEFGKGPASNTSTDVNQPAVSLQDPRDVLADLGMDGGAETASQQSASRSTRRSGTSSTRSASTSTNRDNSSTGLLDRAVSAFNGGLSPSQKGLLNKISDPKERERMEIQMLWSNMESLKQLLSNLEKMQSDTRRAIIQNIRS